MKRVNELLKMLPATVLPILRKKEKKAETNQ